MGDPATIAVWLIVLPLAWATASFTIPGSHAAWTSIIGLAVQTALSLYLAARLVDSGQSTHQVGGWGAPLGIDLAVDGLSTALIVLTQLVAFTLAIYARTYYSHDEQKYRYFWPLTGFLIAGMNALFVSADLFNLYVTLEVVGLTAVSLVAMNGEAKQIAAALRYLFAALLGSGAYLLGVALIYGAYGTVSLETLSPLIENHTPPLAVWLAATVMLAGLMIKTALFPFHYWLPPAHSGATVPVSALLSALVVKASFYLILRLWTGMFAPLTEGFAGLTTVLGGAAILWGSWKAIRAHRIKILIAYSTVAQLGYLFLALSLPPSTEAVQIAVIQIYAHGLAKASMFVAAGVLIMATGHDTMSDLAGTAGRLPLTLFSFGLAGTTLMGLPPSSGFLAKWKLIDAALAHGQWPIAVIVLAGGLLAAIYVFRILSFAFLISPSEEKISPVPRTLEWTAFILAISSVVLGLRGVELMRLVTP